MGQAIPDYPIDLFSHDSVRNARAVDDTLREFSPVVRLADGQMVDRVSAEEAVRVGGVGNLPSARTT